MYMEEVYYHLLLFALYTFSSHECSYFWPGHVLINFKPILIKLSETIATSNYVQYNIILSYWKMNLLVLQLCAFNMTRNSNSMFYKDVFGSYYFPIIFSLYHTWFDYPDQLVQCCARYMAWAKATSCRHSVIRICQRNNTV